MMSMRFIASTNEREKIHKRKPVAPGSFVRKASRWRCVQTLLAYVHVMLSTSMVGVIGFISILSPTAVIAKEYVPYIVGGDNAFPTDHPFQVAILYADVSDNRLAHFCGGSLIAADLIVTAAHCSDGTTASQVQVLTGTQRLDGTGVRHNVSRFYIHPNYDRETYDYDIAIWKLSSKVTGIEYATLASSNGPLGGNLLVTGWGNTNPDIDVSAIDLQRALVPLADSDVCTEALWPLTRHSVNETMLCAGFAGVGPDSCRRDSGGPLTGGVDNTVLTGIVSWGSPYCDSYGVYTRISHPGVKAFIERIMSGVEARVWLHPSTGSGFQETARIQSLAQYWDDQKWLVGDFDGDGLDDLVNIYGRAKPDGTQETRAWVHASNGYDFELFTSIDTLAGYWDKQRWLVGNFNGDEYDDLVNIYGRDKPDGTQETRVWVHASTGTGFEQQTSLQTLAGYWEGQRWLVGDFTGDGFDDLVNIYGRDRPDGTQETRVWMHASTGTGFEYLTSLQTLAGYWDSQKWMVGKFNNDRYADLVNIYGRDKPDGTQETRVWVHASTGSGFEYLTRLQTLAGYWDSQQWVVGNPNGDEMDDLINIYFQRVPGSGIVNRVWVHESTASGFEYLSSLQSLGYWALINGDWQNQHWLMGKFTRDEPEDIVRVYGRRLN